MSGADPAVPGKNAVDRPPSAELDNIPGEYRLLRQIGSAGMGTVLHAIGSNRHVVRAEHIHAQHGGAALARGPGATSFDDGRLGPKKIVGDQILPGDITIFTRDKIEQYGDWQQ